MARKPALHVRLNAEIAERVERDRQALGDLSDVGKIKPKRVLTDLEVAEAAEFASMHRMITLDPPVVIPDSRIRCFAYDPERIPAWLQAVLAEQVAA